MEILCTNLATNLCRELENQHIEQYRREYERRNQATKLRNFQSTIKLAPSDPKNSLRINIPRARLNTYNYSDYSITIGYLLSTPRPFGAPYLHATQFKEKYYPKKDRSYRYFLTKPENVTSPWSKLKNVTQYSDNVYIQNVKANVVPIKNPRHWVKSNRFRKFRRKSKHPNYTQMLNSLVEI